MRVFYHFTRACARLQSSMQPQMPALLPPLQYTHTEDLVQRQQEMAYVEPGA